MSLRPSYYGGFPGPPEQTQPNQRRHQEQARGYNPPAYIETNQDVTYYSDGTGYFQRNVDTNNSFNGNHFISPEVYYTPYNYFPNQPEYTFEHGYTPARQQIDPYPIAMVQPAVELSPNNYYASEASPSSNVNITEVSANRPAIDTTATSSGKSRRFSRQRNIKETGAMPGTSGEVVSHNEDNKGKIGNRAKKQMSKHSIRFSHQREETSTNSKQASRVRVKSEGFENKKTVLHLKKNNEQNSAMKEGTATVGIKQDTTSVKGNSTKAKREYRNMKLLPDERNQTSVLLEQLSAGTYECMVCCDRVRPQHAVWSCSKCYNLFHMGCIKKWARSPSAKVEESGWRCPGCQNVTKNVPASYYCFCGKVREPEWNRDEIPHSCGDVCGRARRNNDDCTHPCNILCHPGPCPQCPAMVTKHCKCGKTSSRIRCSQQSSYMCKEPCKKLRNCGIHQCVDICHSGKCQDCGVIVEQKCFCGKHTREITCGSVEHKSSSRVGDIGCYSCSEVCERPLSCGNHTCFDVCHPGECKGCPLLPSVVTVCPCTQTKLSAMKNDDGSAIVRKECTDPIATCGKICNKPLACGGENIHTCQLPCHVGKCPPCSTEESTIFCRCGKSEKDVSCTEYVTMDGGYICDRRCNKKRKCGRHKCGQTCCLNTEHACNQLCGRKLTCGLHRCEDFCHRGACHTCYNVSFDELRCYCGDQVIFPPIACGTKAPECVNECTRMHACTHPVRHTCHTDENCPPCVELVKKKCNCGRVVRGNIMCHIDNVSCGAPCRKVLPCGHKCLKPCHKESCTEVDESCKQPCSIMRIECIHPCASPCHYGSPCPVTSCKATVTLKCNCGRREEQVECSQGGAMIQSINSAACAIKESIDIGKIIRSGSSNLRTLPCNEECALIERNRRLAEALKLTDVEYGSQSKQQYSEFLVNAAKSEGAFVRTVEKELINLVESVQWLSSPKQSYSFPIMKREKRQIIHELSEAFKCKSESHDEEPNRNVVVIATKDVSKLPSPLLSDVVIEHVTAEKSVTSRPTGRLLTSMKFVSYRSSKVSMGDPEVKRTLQMTRNTVPATSARAVAYKPPHVSSRESGLASTRSRFDAITSSSSSSSREPVHRYGGSTTQGSTVAPANTPASKPAEPQIDYFDMTE